MATSSTPDKRYFLNRLALDHACDPLSLDPYWVLQQLFNKSSPEVIQESFSQFCESAIAPAFVWGSATPGSLVLFTEEIEQLIEACFLLQGWFKVKKGPVSKTDDSPGQIVRQFFKVQNLAGWKQWLHSWKTAALSTRSVAAFVSPEDLVPFVQWMEKLLPAAALLAKEGKKK